MFIYTIVNSENLKLYVGQHKGNNLQKYLQTKLSDSRHHRNESSHLFRAMRKYPKSVWSIHPLLSDLQTRDEVNDREQFYIRVLKTQHPDVGYNIRLGGEGYSNSRDEAIASTQRGVKKPEGFGEKMRRALTGRTWTPEQREKIPAGVRRTLASPEAKTKRSAATRALWAAGRMDASVEARRGVPRPPDAVAAMHTPEAKAKAAASRRGRKLSPDHVAGISERKRLWWAQHPDYRLPASRNAKISATMKGKAPLAALRAAHSPETEAKRQLTRLIKTVAWG